MYSSILSTKLGRYAKQQDVTTTVLFIFYVYSYMYMLIKRN